jgi:hypothetical protein
VSCPRSLSRPVGAQPDVLPGLAPPEFGLHRQWHLRVDHDRARAEHILVTGLVTAVSLQRVEANIGWLQPLSSVKAEVIA